MSIEPSASIISSSRPERILLAREVAESVLAKRVISRLPGVPVELVDDHQDPLRAKVGNSGLETRSRDFSAGKKDLLLCRYKGDWLRACPGTNSHVCCNLWTVNPGEGCPLDCTYCYLQSYLKRNPTLKLYTNTDEMLGAIEQKVKAEPSRFFRVGTGEVIDSLVWDDLTDSTLELVPFFARQSNALLELKTKTANIGNLVDLGSRYSNNTVVSWSVNAKPVNFEDESATASFDERLLAMAEVQEAGYRIGLHFDPLIYFSGWEDGYQDAVREIFEVVDPDNVAWVSVSTLRYKPEMQEVMETRFPESKIPYGEQFLAKDGKMRYVQPLRLKMIKFVWHQLKQVSNTLPSYMCMESPAAWRAVSGGAPVAGEELREVFTRKGRLNIIQPQGSEL